ncbi:TIGR00304 family membrane protein [Archaeoglobus veneficus]|uniref:TIGR00304 family protein n=1 Tax=Archaeoglobus veneficus (strain DSM 11195 / SNP6) TaxID=693661 RepID=F2KPE0_ARCVS|nr:TIGR00304 family protein [Archaeoglobus veneficus]AEA46371.1 protein of unknown function DUF131 [Archaeoglobus veneficus SNP6]
MLEIVAVALILLGLYMVFRGLTESYEPPTPYEWEDVDRRRQEIEEDEWEGWKEWEKHDREREGRKIDVKGGGVILIGPIPIVFGESRFAVYALILAIVLMLLSILFMIMATQGVSV